MYCNMMQPLIIAICSLMPRIILADVRDPKNQCSRRVPLMPAAPVASGNWGYHHYDDDLIGPDKWTEEFITCAGKRQSPIEIHSPTLFRPPQQPGLAFANYGVVPDGCIWSLINDGRTVKVTGSFEALPTISEGGLPAAYEFDSFHFHWGGNSSLGSEHVVDGKSYPLEVHLVHKLKKQKDQTDQLAVLGIFFELTTKPEEVNPYVRKLVGNIRRIAVSPSKINARFGDMVLDDLLPSNRSFYRYPGSLTVPPCTESVTWTVFLTPLKITEDLLAVFRQLYAFAPLSARPVLKQGIPLTNTYRHPQQLNDRLVQVHLE